MAYGNALLWALFLIISTWIIIGFERSGLSVIAVSGFFRFLGLSLNEHGALLLAYTAFILFFPFIGEKSPRASIQLEQNSINDE